MRRDPALDSASVRVAGRDPGSALLAAAAGATACVLGLISIERRSLWIDEAVDVDWAQQSWSDLVRVAFQNEGSQALYLLFLKPWLAVTSTDEWVVRFPSVLFTALAAALLVVLGDRLFQSRLVGFGAGLLLATNAFVVSWSQQVRQYSLAMLLAVVATYLFVRALESEGWGWWLAYGAVAGVSVYAHFYVAFVLASHVPALFVSGKPLAVRRWAVASAIGLVIALPALDFALNHDTGQVSWIPELEYEYVEEVVHAVSGESWALLAVGAIGLCALAYGATRYAADSWRYVLVASWLIVPLLLACAVSVFKPMLLDRYLIVAAPALALASAYAVSRLGQRAGAVALVALVAVGLLHVRDWYGSFIEQDWRGAVALAERERQPSEQLLVYPGWLYAPVTYYAEAPPDTSEVLSTDRAWVVSLADRATEIEAWASGSGYEVAEKSSFVSVETWRLEKRESP
jgi:mannosyltransferase